MPHHVYQTKAFVLGGTNIADANRFVDLFTEELGLVRAVARSVRRERSKMRYSLQPYSFSHVSLVRGREVWRLTGAGEDYSAYQDLRDNPDKVALLEKVMKVLRRTLQGEERNDYLFETVRECFRTLREDEIPRELMKAYEYLTVYRILYSLGYIPKKGDYFETNTYELDMLERVLEEEKEIIEEINRALKESQL